MQAADLVAYVDVDDTLVRSSGTKRIPMTAVVDHVRGLHRSGVTLYCWSAGGADYARRSARELGIEDAFTGFLPKPHLLVDDQPPSEWPNFMVARPAGLASMTVQDHISALAHQARANKTQEATRRQAGARVNVKDVSQAAMAEVKRTSIVYELRQLLVALASPGEVALEHARAASCRPDELALDYDNFVHAFVGNFAAEVSSQQRRALLRVDGLFSAMSGKNHADLWTESAVASHPRWAEVRAAAQQALDLMSWRPE